MTGIRPSPERLRSGLLHAEERRARRRAAYYAQFNGNPEFLAGLRTLAAEVDPGTLEYPRVARQLWAFARTWHLPRKRARIELAGSLRLAAGTQAEPRLIVPSIGYWVPDTVAEFIPSLSPIHYDPTVNTLVQLEARFEQAAAELGDQVEAFRQWARALAQRAQAAGWQREHPRWLAAGELDRLARRLYLRAVFDWTYGAIAEAEDKTRAGYVSPQTVAKSVKDWAADLDVTLPAGRGLPG